MTRLELVQELVRLSGISDAVLPTTTLNQTGALKKAVSYIDMAHKEIQTKFFDWLFLWGTGTITTESGTALYDGESDLGMWDEDQVRYLNVALPAYQWPDFVRDDVSTGPPEAFVIRPDNKIQLLPTPDAVYSLPYEYYKKPLVLAADSDEPLIPEQFQLAIIGRAMILYANFESAEEVKIQGSELYMEHFNALKKYALPRNRQTYGRSESMDITVVPE